VRANLASKYRWCVIEPYMIGYNVHSLSTIPASHILSLFLPFRCDPDHARSSLLSMPLTALSASTCLPDQAAERIAKFHDKTPKAESLVWSRRALKVSRDLHAHLSGILSLPPTKTSPRAETLGMGDRTRYLLEDGQSHSVTKGAVLALNKRARTRLAPGMVPDWNGTVVVNLTDIAAHIFETGFGLLIMTVTVAGPDGAAPPAAAINEALVALCHDYDENLHWQGSSRAFSIRGLAADLLGDARPGGKWPPRLFSYSALQFSADIPEQDRRLLALRLARKYSHDYQINDWTGTALLTPFDTVLHAISIEGGATVVTNPDGIDFLSGYVTNVAANVYRPLAAISYHEFVILMEFTSSSVFEDDLGTAALNLTGYVKYFEGLRDKLLQFRSRYRFSHASMVTMHNLVHSAWRTSLGLETMLADVDRDVADAHQRFLEKHAQRQAERARRRLRIAEQAEARAETWVTLVEMAMGAAAGFLTGFAAVKELLETSGHGHGHEGTFMLSGAIGGALGALLAWWKAGKERARKRRQEVEDESSVEKGGEVACHHVFNHKPEQTSPVTEPALQP
jgi:hypothetical protein